MLVHLLLEECAPKVMQLITFASTINSKILQSQALNN